MSLDINITTKNQSDEFLDLLLFLKNEGYRVTVNGNQNINPKPLPIKAVEQQ